MPRSLYQTSNVRANWAGYQMIQAQERYVATSTTAENKQTTLVYLHPNMGPVAVGIELNP
jgi:hypothetical protein